MTVESELRRLVGMLRQPRPSAMEEGVAFGTAVRDPATGVSEFRYLRNEERAQLDKCAYELQRDLRFEYLTKLLQKKWCSLSLGWFSRNLMKITLIRLSQSVLMSLKNTLCTYP